MIDSNRIQFLTKCAWLDDTSWGEMITSLVNLYYNNHGLINPEFADSLEKEVTEHLEWAEQHCKITFERHSIPYEEEVLEISND